MAKKHADRPALRAVDVFRWILAGILQTKPVRRTAVMYLTTGKSVRQTWWRRRRGKVIKQTAVTYLRKGLFLVPIWIAVPDWEIQLLQSSGISLENHGITRIKGRNLRLYYMQVEDLDHAVRQQVHVLDQYLDLDHPSMNTFRELFQMLAHAERIIRKARQRKVGTDALLSVVQISLRVHKKSVRNLILNAPLFHRTTTEKERQPVVTRLLGIAQECRSLTMRPVGVRLGRAARSLEIAVGHIKTGHFKQAQECLQSAANNLKYPQPQG